MSKEIINFYRSLKDKIAKESDLADFFVYFLTSIKKLDRATVSDLKDCYIECDLACPSWLPSYMSKGLKSKPKKFVKRTNGYRLEAANHDRIAIAIGQAPLHSDTSSKLFSLLETVTEGIKRDFLEETISCFHIGANRAATVMCWNLTLYHLHEYILANSLDDFNKSLTANKDKRVKVKAVSKMDDFSEMPEGKFLEFCREAKIINSGIFSKLKIRLDERNSAAHPSGVKILPKPTEVYIEDLVENVINKYKIF